MALYRWVYNRAARQGQAASFTRTEPGRRGWLRDLLARYVLVPDGQVCWLPGATAAALRSLRSEPCDLLYSTSPPVSAHLLGALLKQLTGLRWVADFRDGWTCDPLESHLTHMPYRRALERRLEARVVASADAVLASTEIAAELLVAEHPCVHERLQVIPNGFDPVDFGHALQAPPPSPSGPLVLLHAGSFAASHPQRSPQPLFDALTRLIEDDPGWSRRLRLRLAGNLTAAERKAAGALVDAGVVELLGALPRAEVLASMAAAHVLVLVDHLRPGPASNVPGKLYEYLAVGRPVLALCGPGMVERLCQRLDAGLCVPPLRVEEIARAIEQLHERMLAGKLTSGVEPSRLQPYHRRELTRQLASCFDRVLAPGGRSQP